MFSSGMPKRSKSCIVKNPVRPWYLEDIPKLLTELKNNTITQTIYTVYTFPQIPEIQGAILEDATLIGKLNISFTEFFAKNPNSSTRLTNMVLRAVDDAYVAFPTVLEYWEDRNSACRRIRLIDGFGGKSIEELDRRILDFLRDSRYEVTE